MLLYLRAHAFKIKVWRGMMGAKVPSLKLVEFPDGQNAKPPASGL
jgi:hypothetical protein